MTDGKRIGVLGKIGLVIAGIALIASVSATAQLRLEMNKNYSEFSELKEELEIVNRKLVKLSAQIVEMEKLREDIWVIDKRVSVQTAKIIEYSRKSEDAIRVHTDEIDMRIKDLEILVKAISSE